MSRDHLFELIQSLTGSEKRYFKIFAARHVIGEKNNYVQLFDALDGLEEYEADEFRKTFADAPFMKHFSSEKNYLHRLILKSMRMYSAEKKTDARISALIADADFLRDKGLYSQSRQALQKAGKLARKFEENARLIQIIDRERSLIRGSTLTGMSEEVSRLADQVDDALIRIEKEVQMARLYDEVFLTFRTGISVSDQEKAEVIAARFPGGWLDNPPEDLTLRAWVDFHAISARYHDLRREFTKAHKHFLDLEKRWEENKWAREEYHDRYKIDLANLLGSYFRQGEFERFPDLLDRIKNLPNATFDQEAEIFQNVYYYELLYLMNVGKLEEAAAKVPEIRKGLKYYSSKISKSRELAFSYNITILFLFIEDHREALEWNMHILNNVKSEHRMDIQRAARLFDLLFHWELEHHDIIDYRLRSVRRYLKKHGDPNEFEAAILDLFREFSGLAGNPRQAKCLQSFRENLETLGPKFSRQLGFSEFKLWAGAYAGGTPLRSALNT